MKRSFRTRDLKLWVKLWFVLLVGYWFCVFLWWFKCLGYCNLLLCACFPNKIYLKLEPWTPCHWLTLHSAIIRTLLVHLHILWYSIFDIIFLFGAACTPRSYLYSKFTNMIIYNASVMFVFAFTNLTINGILLVHSFISICVCVCVCICVCVFWLFHMRSCIDACN